MEGERDEGAAEGGASEILRPYFQLMAEKRASDLFITANAPVKIKIEGQIYPAAREWLSADHVREIAQALMTDAQRAQLARERELDFALFEPVAGRFRVSIFLQRGTPALVLRYISAEVPRIASLGLPEIAASLMTLRRGLVLLTGGAGCGKSTTMAAMIDVRNETTSSHIVTIEDPIEFLHTHKRSMVHQREVGIDTRSFAKALAGVRRAAPDVVALGALAGREMLEAAVDLATTGHLVLATFHAGSCVDCLHRLMQLFPESERAYRLHELSQCLRAVLAQRLLQGPDRRRVAVMETLLNTAGISTLIGSGDLAGLRRALEAGEERGVQSFDAALCQLNQEGRIERAEALAAADSRERLAALMAQAGNALA